ncbi:2-oxo-tetronate isomerase [Derxia lacustris]|uniref:2-oxo-tetronate isomerase n=1 Tax=Derxia lacustris TaxID=764842 RepID=UPI00111C85BB|nr:2-oxo-tetronate isomerase [Derxia lacustris]
MANFAANLSMMYTEHAFLDRFAAAARDGFAAVEYLFPYVAPAGDLAVLLRDHGLKQVLFNAPPGDWDAGERGIASLPGREDEFRRAFAIALEYALVLDCPRIHVMAGLLPAGADAAEHARRRAVYVANLAWAAEQAATVRRDVLMEPINTRDIPGYFINRQDEAHAICLETGAANLKVQMDLYHCQIVEGDITAKLRALLPTGRVAHLQIAGVPARNEPDEGDLNYPWLFRELDRLGYDGWIGCEYRPRADTSEGLGWLRALRAEGIAR